MIMIVKTPGSQMGSPAAAEEGGDEVGGGRWESGERSEVQARSNLHHLHKLCPGQVLLMKFIRISTA